MQFCASFFNTWGSWVDEFMVSIGRNKFYDGALHPFKWYDLQIETLKRLQREAFSDIMKLRDRQDKVERIITLHKSSKGNPFQEASTHVRGKVDVLGGFFIMDGVDVHKCDLLQRSGSRTGVDARFTFETAVREKDIFLAEFTASEKGQGDSFGGPLSLTKVLYGAHFRNWFSAVAIPMGARCRDVEVATDSHQVKFF